MATLIPVILAGGKGERFWPVSRLKRPKQFLCLDGSGRSLLQSTADRLLKLTGEWNS
jgi:mannose-1-phosphate guanylyltransferase